MTPDRMESRYNGYRFLDVGGTYVKIPGEPPVPVNSAGSREEIAAGLIRAIGPLKNLKGIGIAIPGPFDYREGVFRMEHKYAAVYGENFAELAGVPAGFPVKYMHDVTSVLEGALRMLELEGNVALATLGTGLGFCVALDGKVQYNPAGSPAHSIWKMPWNNGILEDVVSARGIRDAYAAKTGIASASALDVALAANAGDESAMEVYSELGTALGESIAELLEELEIKTLLMGGQISKSLKLMDRPLRNALEGVRIMQAPEGAVFEGLKTLFNN